MKPASALSTLTFPERLNFLVTNRIPRRWLTLLMGRFSRVENPVVRALSIGVWRLFADDLRLHEAKQRSFRSLHDCFTRELTPGARPVCGNPKVVVSPCDAVIGSFGNVRGLKVLQAKGFPYTIDDLLGDEAWAERCRDSRYVTLRLKSSMYHRFHAPADAAITRVNYITGDTWNVNPIALRVVERLYCKNERVAIDLRLADDSESITLVAVAAILVASVRLHGLDVPLDLRYAGPNAVELRRRLRKGDEIGWFEHGSTIVMLVPGTFRFCDNVVTGETIRMGQALMRRSRLRHENLPFTET